MNKEIDMQTDLTHAECFRLLAHARFRSFTQNDWDLFSGCESADPLIADEVFLNNALVEDSYLIVIDGDIVSFLREGDEFGGQMFKLKEI